MPHLSRARRRAGAINRRRRHPALVGIEVMLDGKTNVQTELVAGCQLAPVWFVALRRCHARFVPYMREVREFHLTSSKIFVPNCDRQSPAQSRCFYCSEHTVKAPTLPLWLTHAWRIAKHFD